MPAKKRSRSGKASGEKPLSKYREKRDFSRTAEPVPKDLTPGEGPLTFVIQKHDATRLHYDFRLELDGVLLSWSVPKGPSLDPGEKRLAVHVEDHPIDYGTFEGVIAKGEYGAGEVIVWDNGTYSPDEDGLVFGDRDQAQRQMRDALAAEKLSITLRGRKLKGSWTLVKIAREEKEWLLIKHKDGTEDPERDVLEEDASVISGLTIDDLKEGHLPDRSRPEVVVTAAGLPGAKAASMPAKLLPMNATPVDTPFSNDDWVFEPKLDGIRAVSFVRDGDVRLQSRRGLNATKTYPGIVLQLTQQPVASAVFDGEIVALDEDGRPSFELLQQRMNLTGEHDIQRAETDVPVLYYVFDLLYLDGYDLSGVTLDRRRQLLDRVLLPTARVYPTQHFEGDGVVAFEAMRDYGMEGVIAKRRDSTYQSGQRSKAWLKIKATESDEFVVGGYTAGQGGRRDTFGALAVGQYDDDGRLVYAGNVGSGFDDRTLSALRKQLDAIERKRSPFDSPLPVSDVTWVRPELVVEVKFSQWTGDGHLRAPVFMRVREDLDPSDVQRIEVVSAPDEGPAQEQAASLDDDVAGVLEQLKGAKNKLSLNVQGHTIALTNLDKEFWPKRGRKRALTKGDLITYLATVSPYLLPHLRHRPLTLTRYPNGIEGDHFYQKHWEGELPDFVDTVSLFSSHNEGDGDYLICNSLPTLLWLGQLADLELHTWYSRVSPEPDGHHLPATFSGSIENMEASLLNHPDFIVFDLDPYIYSGKEKKGDEPELNKKAFAATVQVARWLKEALDSMSLSSFVKTTGRTGLHIYVPVIRQLDYDSARAFSETVGKHLLRRHPKQITMEWTVDKRTGKVFFDHNQNTRGKTLASIYSPRPSPDAAVSMPVRWDELDDIYPTDFTILTAPKRLADVGDLWSNILNEKHDIEALLG